MAADHLHDPAVAHLREAAAAPLGGRGHAQHAQLGQAVDHRARDVGVAVDRGGVDVRRRRTARTAATAASTAGPLGLGQLGVGEERRRRGTRRGTGPWRIRSPRRSGPAAPPPGGSAWPAAPRRSRVRSGCSGAEVVVAMAVPPVSPLGDRTEGATIVAGPPRNSRPGRLEKKTPAGSNLVRRTAARFRTGRPGERLHGRTRNPASWPTQNAMTVAEADHQQGHRTLVLQMRDHVREAVVVQETDGTSTR